MKNSYGLCSMGALVDGDPIVKGGAITGYTYFHNGRPVFKYPPGSNYERDYPFLTHILKTDINYLADNEIYVRAISKYTNMDENEIKKNLRIGNGPLIEIRNDTYQLAGNRAVWGLFLKDQPEKIILNKAILDKMEYEYKINKYFNSSELKAMKKALVFVVTIKLIHEFVHWGEFKYNSDKFKFEEGNAFERELFGGILDVLDNKVYIVK